jgi:cell division protein FtsW
LNKYTPLSRYPSLRAFLAASGLIEVPIGFDAYHFVKLSFIVMLGVSLLDKRIIRRAASLGLLICLIIMALLPFIGTGTKGAIRWLDIGITTVQPSEFLKPCFIIVIAWVLSERQKTVGFPAYRIAVGLFLFSCLLLLIQPDVGMMMTLTMIFGVQLFLSGIPILWVVLLAVAGIAALAGTYLLFPHVANRINGFLDPASTDNYQVQKSLEAFASGGITGRGPGEGIVKWLLPDAHTDFIYAVIGEEFGLLVALFTIGIFTVIVMRGLYRALYSQDVFILLAVAGLVTQLGLQAFINMGVAVHLLPAKGMTLPFLSYGGSSLLAIALSAGGILGLTRRQYGSIHRTNFDWEGNM